MTDSRYHKLREMVRASSNIVFFGGAGTSTESGIPDFRSEGGLYHANDGGRYSPEEILSRDFFMRDVEAFYEFYKAKMIYKDAKPHSGHYALARLEREGKLKAIITQNIDGMHQLAGNQNVLELHGSIHRNYCIECNTFASLDEVLRSEGIVPRCKSCGGIIKPDVVLYQENLNMKTLDRAVDYIAQADVMIVAGTSLTVHPAAGLIRYYQGDKLILINKSETPYDSMAQYLIQDSIAEAFERIF